MSQSKIGVVISDKMKKTIVIKVVSKVKHPLYKKLIKRSKHIKAHDEMGVKVGETVKITKTKPYSKTVHFKVTEVIK